MDRTMRNESGFTLIEIVIVMAIVGILSAITLSRYDHLESVNSINEDMHRVTSFFQSQKMFAFTQKQNVEITVNGKDITTIIDANADGDYNDVGAGEDLVGDSYTAENTLTAVGSPFTIGTRGLITGGSIRITAVNTGAEYTCVEFDNIRIRIGEWDVANAECDVL